MDPHVRWVHDRIVRTLARSAALTFALVLASAAAILRTVTRAPTAVMAPVATGLALAATALLLARAALTNPFSAGWLRARSRASHRLAIGPADPLARPLTGGLRPTAAAWTTTDPPRPVVDLYLGPAADAVVVRQRGEGWLSVLGRIDDGRILVTDTVSPVPHSHLVINLAADGGLEPLLASHREAVAALAAAGHRMEPAGPGLYLEVRAVEQAALALLGPWLGPFANPFPSGRPLRFLRRVRPRELLDLALRTGHPGGRAR